MTQDYTAQAKPTTVKGHRLVGLLYDEHEYASVLEARMASLLIQHRIPFTPHLKFECWGPKGKSFFYTIDFFLSEPIRIAGSSTPVQAIEVKGVLKPYDFIRAEALKYCHGYKCFIVLEPHISYFESYGLNPVTPHTYGGGQ